MAEAAEQLQEQPVEEQQVQKKPAKKHLKLVDLSTRFGRLKSKRRWEKKTESYLHFLVKQGHLGKMPSAAKVKQLAEKKYKLKGRRNLSAEKAKQFVSKLGL